MSQIGFAMGALFSAAWLAVKVMALLLGVLGLWLVPVAGLLNLMSRRTLGSRGGYAPAMTAVQIAAVILIAISPLTMWMLSALPRSAVLPVGFLVLLAALAFAIRQTMRDEGRRTPKYWRVAGWSVACAMAWCLTTELIVVATQTYVVSREPGMIFF
ncbi:MAG: hypothetical protein JF591_21935 [Lysobacter sp.]|nr:hypothetical protein [Lysobacter sp.]